MNLFQVSLEQQRVRGFLLGSCSLSAVATVGRWIGFALILTLGVSAPVSAQESDGIEEIIVTAQKREQSLQEVPVSIAVFSAEMIEKFNARDFSDFADMVPGLSYATTGVGNSQYIIRGIGQVGTNLSPTTGVYLDEIPLQTHTTSQPDPILFDVARIEVLRGPQGVLFGSSAMGGTVRVITNQPDASQYEALVDVGLATIEDGAESWDVKAMFNVPLVDDRLALRIVAARGFDGGWIDDLKPVTRDLFENINNPSAIIEDINSTDYEMVRASLRYTPDETLAITTSILYQKSESDVDRQFSDVTFGIESRLRARYQDTWSDDEFLLANLSIEKDLDILGGISFLSSTSYFDRDIDIQFDSSAFRSSQIEAIVGPSPDEQLYWSGSNRTGTTEQITQEFRAVSTSDSSWQYIVGVYFNSMEQDLHRFRPANNLFGVPAPLPFGASSPPNVEDLFFDFEEDEFAVFGEITYTLSDYWNISVGGRYFDYDQTDTRSRYGLGGVAGGDLIFEFSEKGTEDGFTPRVVLSYQPTDNVNLYGSFSSGFRTGGVNQPIDDSSCSAAEREAAGLPDVPPPFGSDETDTLELGAKTSWRDGRVTVNASVYSIDWKDFQQNVSTTCGVNQQLIVNFTANAGAVESDGAEVEFAIQFSDDFVVSGGAAYTDAIYTEAFTNLGLPAGASLLDVPELMWNIRAEYSFPFSQYWDGHVMLAANYVDETITGFGEGEPEPRPEYSVIDFMGTLTRDTLSVSFFVDNITDETQVYGQEFATSPSRTTATSWFGAHTGQPRTVGVRLRKRFE
jgi:iron complex outermembrane receptor protein